MTRGEIALLVACVVLLGTYIASGIWLATRAKKLPLLRDEEQEDQRSQKRRS